MAFGNLLGVLVAPRERKRAVLRSALAIALGLVSVAAPLCLSRDWPIARTVMAFGFAVGFMRVIEVVRNPTGTTTRTRALAVIFLFIDPRRFVRVPRELRLDSLSSGIVESGLAVALFLAPYPSRPGVLRTVIGATSAYLVVEGAARLAEAFLALAGVRSGPLHDAPIRARTVGEFWSRRWNLAVHVWLNEHAFRPTAVRLGSAMGVMAAFGASAILHFVPIWIALDWQHAMVMGSFFVLHGGIVIVESKLGVVRWRRVLGHAWTLGTFAVTVPLFVEPLLASLGR